MARDCRGGYVSAAQLPASTAPGILPFMPEPTYLAELTETDYSRFREKDPTLPETYSAWLRTADERVQILRSQGEIPVRYPIRFRAFAQRNDRLGISSFDRAARDDYADEQGRAHTAAL